MSCSVCGADLGMADTVRLPLEYRVKPASGSALWLDDLSLPAAGSEPDAEPRTAPIILTLRDIHSTAPPEVPQNAPAPLAALATLAFDLVQSDDATQSPLLDPAAATVQRQPTDASQRAERRAAVRRDRRIAAPAAPQACTGASEVLLVGSPDVASDPLCSLLQSFGFTVHTTADSAEALAHAASPALLASFVRAEMSDGNGGNGIDLCAQLRQAAAREAGGRELLLVLVAARLRPMDRVRAELAGCDGAIAAPVTRGSVARLLEARGIRMPSDPRQA